MNLLTYDQVRSSLGKTSHLLLGNGFSIAFDKRFQYGSLYDFAKSDGLPESVQGVFEHLGTNNFEGVMRLLDEGSWLADHYGLLKPKVANRMKDDLDAVKEALIKAIAKTHPDHTHEVSDAQKQACFQFLEPFHNIFTLNYDLLLYWVSLHGLDKLERRDGFRQGEDGEDDPYVVFTEHVGSDSGIFFIHGALHLYVADGELRKHSWKRTNVPLIESVRKGLAKNQFPLFVAEGRPEQKLEQIQRSGYLSYCLSKLGRIQKDLVTFGMSFGESDQHICDVLARNRKLTTLYVGLYGDPKSELNRQAVAGAKRVVEHRSQFVRKGLIRDSLAAKFYDASSCSVWK